MNQPVLSLLTDFGSSYYVGQMKAVLASMVPNAIVIDLSHEIEPQNIVQGAAILQDCMPHMPSGTIQIAVVDPGVGTSRPIVAARIGDWTLVAPDNGLLSSLASDWTVHELVRLDQPRWWRSDVSRTFHGRDVMAPVAAALALGNPLRSMGSDWGRLETDLIPKVERRGNGWVGCTLFSDRYGNLLTNLRPDKLLITSTTDRFKVRAAATVVRGEVIGPVIGPVNGCEWIEVMTPHDGQTKKIPWISTYAEAKRGELVALVSSSGRLEISVSGGNARQELGTSHAQVTIGC